MFLLPGISVLSHIGILANRFESNIGRILKIKDHTQLITCSINSYLLELLPFSGLVCTIKQPSSSDISLNLVMKFTSMEMLWRMISLLILLKEIKSKLLQLKVDMLMLLLSLWLLIKIKFHQHLMLNQEKLLLNHFASNLKKKVILEWDAQDLIAVKNDLSLIKKFNQIIKFIFIILLKKS